MAVTFVAWGPINTSGTNQNFQNTGGAVTPALPSEIQSGDLIVLFCGNNDGTNATGFANNEYSQVLTANGTSRVSILTKTATGSDANPVVTTSGTGLTNDPSMVLVGVFRGVNTALGLFASNSRNTTVGTVFEYPATPTLLSEGWDNGSVVLICSYRPNDYTNAPADAGGYTITHTETTLGSDGSIVAAYQLKTPGDPPVYAEGDFGSTASGAGTAGSTSALAVYKGSVLTFNQVILI